MVRPKSPLQQSEWEWKTSWYTGRAILHQDDSNYNNPSFISKISKTIMTPLSNPIHVIIIDLSWSPFSLQHPKGVRSMIKLSIVGKKLKTNLLGLFVSWFTTFAHLQKTVVISCIILNHIGANIIYIYIYVYMLRTKLTGHHNNLSL